jgi:hypothetical protein
LGPVLPSPLAPVSARLRGSVGYDGPMLHLTLNTGHCYELPRSDVGDDILPTVRPWLKPGEHNLPMPSDCRLEVCILDRGWIGTVYSGKAPLVTIGIAATELQADAVWPALESMYLVLTDKSPFAAADWKPPRRPAQSPWVAAVIVGAMPETVANLITDLERCLAWAWVEMVD